MDERGTTTKERNATTTGPQARIAMETQTTTREERERERRERRREDGGQQADERGGGKTNTARVHGPRPTALRVCGRIESWELRVGDNEFTNSLTNGSKLPQSIPIRCCPVVPGGFVPAHSAARHNARTPAGRCSRLLVH